jgi:tetratricopeptide (TPR) repeat protein
MLLGAVVLAVALGALGGPAIGGAAAAAAASSDAAIRRLVEEPTYLRKLLEAGQYEDLDRQLSAIERAAAGRYDRENELWAAYIYLAQLRPNNDVRFDQWLERIPSTRARLARAIFRSKQGWTGQARQSLAYVRGEFLTVLKADPDALLAYDGLMMLCLVSEGPPCSAKWLQRGLARAPGSFNLRAMHLFGLKPRWGGTYEQMEAAAADAQKDVALNPRLRHLLGFADADRASVALRERRFAEAIALYTQALTHGPEPIYLAERAQAYVRAKRSSEALVDIEAAKIASPVGWFFTTVRLGHVTLLEATIRGAAGETAFGLEAIGRAQELEVDPMR